MSVFEPLTSVTVWQLGVGCVRAWARAAGRWGALCALGVSLRDCVFSRPCVLRDERLYERAVKQMVTCVRTQKGAPKSQCASGPVVEEVEVRPTYPEDCAPSRRWPRGELPRR